MPGNSNRGAFKSACTSRFRFTVLWGDNTRACLLGLSLAGSLLTGALPAVRAQAPAGKTDLFLQKTVLNRHASGWSSVILRLDGPLTPQREARLKAFRADIARNLPIIQSVAVRVPARNLSALAALPFVKHLSVDAPVRKYDEFTVGHSGAGVAYTNNKLDGTGITVAVLDSGMHGVADLKDLSGHNRVLAQISFVPNDTSTDDHCGHGTHVAGIVGGCGKQSIGTQYYRTFYGIARNCSLVNVRVLNQSGQGSVSSVVSGIQWVVTNASKYKIRVLNLSLGHPVGDHYYNDPLCQACESAWKAGIIVVCAAGNAGRLNSSQTAGLDNEGWGTAYGSIQSPGNDPYVITVGAMKQDLSTAASGSYTGNRSYDRIATYSSRGPSRLDFILKPDIVAPGNKVISLDADNSYLDNYNGNTNDIRQNQYIHTTNTDWSNNYFCLSGTSMAAPVVSGAAALMLQANSNLSPDTIKARLMLSADKWSFPDGTTDACTFGAGYLDIPAALNCTATAGMYAQSPSLFQDSSGNVGININNALWGSNAIWGMGLTSLNAIWGSNALCGSSTLSSSHALWGQSIWSDTAIWGTDISAVDLTSVAIYGE